MELLIHSLITLLQKLHSLILFPHEQYSLFIYPFDNGNDDESIKICGYYNGRLLFSYDEPILFNASQILLPAGGVLEFKFVPSFFPIVTP